jgi:hypothetical protein
MTRVLAVVSRLKWIHVDYLHALAKAVDLRIAWSGSTQPEAVRRAAKEGLPLEPLGELERDGPDEVRARLAALVEVADPEVVHVMYYHHEALVPIAREVVGDRAAVIVEIRDPLTMLTKVPPGHPLWELERAALRAADGHVFVTREVRGYLERAHDLDLEPSSLIVPHAFAGHTMGPPAPKLSERDGRVHLALVGTAGLVPGVGRWYGDIIRRLVAQGLVVHSRFHHPEDAVAEPYLRLAAELPDYRAEPPLVFRVGTQLSEATSRYDLMGVFHELEAQRHNEALVLTAVLPTKAVSGWFHGGIPVVCTAHYRGIVELIEEHGIGFVVDSPDDVGRVAADRDAIGRATARCLALRGWFSQERQAARLVRFYDSLAGSRRGSGGGRPPAVARSTTSQSTRS